MNVDFETLDRRATQTYEIYEPFDKKTITFTGIDMADVLEAGGVPSTAQKLEMTALDEYRVELDIADVRAGGVILATRADGRPIALDHGGPIRIVFEAKNAAGKNTDQWIWSLASVTAT